MFANSVPRITLSYRIDSNLIAISTTTWQTKNITSVSIDQSQLKFVEPEPKFDLTKPAPTTRWGFLALALATAWTIAISTNHPALVGWLLTAILTFGAWFIRHYSHKNNLRIWTRRKEKMESQNEEWLRLVKSIPSTFNLILESASGRSVALSTFDKNALIEVHDAVLTAMRGATTSAMSGSIMTIDSAAGPIDSLYERYCRNEITSA